MKCLKCMHTVGGILFLLAFVLTWAMSVHICTLRLRVCLSLFLASLLLIVPYDVANLMDKPESQENDYAALFSKKYLFFEMAGLLFFAIMLFVIE